METGTARYRKRYHPPATFCLPLSVCLMFPLPYAIASIAAIYRNYPHIGPVLPAMGYRSEQIVELSLTIESTPCDMVLSDTPIDLNRIMAVSRPFTTR